MTSDDETIFVKLADVLARVGEGNFSGFVGINPNSFATAFED